MFKRILAVSLMFGSLVLLPAGAAQADNGCPGTRDAWRTWLDDAGRVAAATELYDTADGGCVSLVSKGIYSGKSKYMRLTVCTTAKTNCVTDSGTFQYYAGPIYRTGSECYWIHATMGDGNGHTIFDKTEYFGYCD